MLGHYRNISGLVLGSSWVFGFKMNNRICFMCSLVLRTSSSVQRASFFRRDRKWCFSVCAVAIIVNVATTQAGLIDLKFTKDSTLDSNPVMDDSNIFKCWDMP